MADQKGWAKARTFTAPEDVAALRAQTEDDKRRYTVEGMVPVACERCGTEVRVGKLTPHHTSVQWRSDPAAKCPRFAEWVQAGGQPALRDGCPDLDSSIVHAVAQGHVEVPDDEDPQAGSDEPTKD